MNAKRKGKEGENELAKVLRGYGYETRRGVQYAGGPESPDVVGLPHIHIECKRVEQLNVTKAYEQAFRDAAENEMPAVFHRKNNEPWMVTMSLEDWMHIYMTSPYGKAQIYDPYAAIALEELE